MERTNSVRDLPLLFYKLRVGAPTCSPSTTGCSAFAPQRPASAQVRRNARVSFHEPLPSTCSCLSAALRCSNAMTRCGSFGHHHVPALLCHRPQTQQYKKHLHVRILATRPLVHRRQAVAPLHRSDASAQVRRREPMYSGVLLRRSPVSAEDLVREKAFHRIQNSSSAVYECCGHRELRSLLSVIFS